MRAIILKLVNLATNSYSKIFLGNLLLLTIYNIHAQSLSYSNQDSWEASIIPIIDGTPAIDNGDELYGSRFALSYFFYNYNRKLELGFDVSAAFLRTHKKKNEREFSKSISIYSPAILARWNFNKLSSLDITPFVTAGVGPSYMTNDDFEGRSLGMRFSFQDIGGIGFKKKITKDNELVFGINIIHYSNASLDEHNRGITLPFSARLAYRF